MVRKGEGGNEGEEEGMKKTAMHEGKEKERVKKDKNTGIRS